MEWRRQPENRSVSLSEYIIWPSNLFGGGFLINKQADNDIKGKFLILIKNKLIINFNKDYYFRKYY